MKPGDLRWVALPARGGHAQSGRRPAIIVQGARATEKLSTVLLIPLTSQLDALRFPGTVLIEPDRANGLQRPSVALAFQLTAVDKRFLEGALGTVTKKVMNDIWRAFDEVTERSAGA
jgi:mRNA-degrading endonuclease toxin of MazEF toxin-antitoxin module